MFDDKLWTYLQNTRRSTVQATVSDMARSIPPPTTRVERAVPERTTQRQILVSAHAAGKNPRRLTRACDNQATSSFSIRYPDTRRRHRRFGSSGRSAGHPNHRRGDETLLSTDSRRAFPVRLVYARRLRAIAEESTRMSTGRGQKEKLSTVDIDASANPLCGSAAATRSKKTTRHRRGS